MQKRVYFFIGALACIAVAFLRPASAQTVVCPLRVESFARVDMTQWRLGFEATQAGAQSGELLLQTNAGWFSASFAGLAATPYVQHWRGTQGSFSRDAFASAPLLVSFPQPVTVQQAAVVRSGGAACPFEPAGDASVISVGPPLQPSVANAADLTLTNPAQARTDLASMSVAATPADSPLPAGCRTTFSKAYITQVVPPYLPEPFSFSGIAYIGLRVDASGTLADAWVWRTSGSSVADDAALRSARSARYVPAQAFCAPVPSTYVFRAEYQR